MNGLEQARALYAPKGNDEKEGQQSRSDRPEREKSARAVGPRSQGPARPATDRSNAQKVNPPPGCSRAKGAGAPERRNRARSERKSVDEPAG